MIVFWYTVAALCWVGAAHLILVGAAAIWRRFKGSLAAELPANPAAAEGNAHPGCSGDPLAAVEHQGAPHRHRYFRWLDPRTCIECGEWLDEVANPLPPQEAARLDAAVIVALDAARRRHAGEVQR